MSERHVEAKRYTDSAIQAQTESDCCLVTLEREADRDSNTCRCRQRLAETDRGMQRQSEKCRQLHRDA